MADEVKRFTPIRGMFDCVLGGDYVLYSDYAAAEAEVANAREAVARARAYADEFAGQAEDAITLAESWRARVEAAEAQIAALQQRAEGLEADARRWQSKYEYALLLIALSQSDGDGMTGVAYSNQVPIARLDDDWTELARLMTDNAVDAQGWRFDDAAAIEGQG